MKISKLSKKEENTLYNEYIKAQNLARSNSNLILPWDEYIIKMSQLKAESPAEFKKIIIGPAKKSLN